MSPTPIDLLVHARWIAPVDGKRTVLDHHALAIHQGRIVGLLPSLQAEQHYAPIRQQRLPDHVLIPGLVNLHGHAAMSLLRGYADDLALMAWLQQHIWPAEAAHLSDEMVYDGTLLAGAEMLRGGITCSNDMYFYPDASARAMADCGMRAAIGITVFDASTRYGRDAEDYLALGLAARDAWLDHPRLRFTLAPHAPYTVSDATFRKVATLAAQLDLPIHCHLHETQDEIEASLREHGVRPLTRLDRLDILGPQCIAVHAVHLNPDEIALLARHGSHVAHCPSSNLKLASGFAPVASLLAAGVNVGLGTDSAASNNRLDLLTEMRSAALLAKAVSGDARAVPAWQALEMATIHGARALGWDQDIGSLQIGKRADLVAVDLSDLSTQPCYDPISHLVYAAERHQVSHVWVDGVAEVSDGTLTRLDRTHLVQLASRWQGRLHRNPTPS